MDGNEWTSQKNSGKESFTLTAFNHNRRWLVNSSFSNLRGIDEIGNENSIYFISFYGRI